MAASAARCPKQNGDRHYCQSPLPPSLPACPQADCKARHRRVAILSLKQRLRPCLRLGTARGLTANDHASSRLQSTAAVEKRLHAAGIPFPSSPCRKNPAPPLCSDATCPSTGRSSGLAIGFPLMPGLDFSWRPCLPIYRCSHHRRVAQNGIVAFLVASPHEICG